MSYPLTPKSALKLQFGDYWPVQRSDDSFGFVVFIGHWGHLRSGFTAALLDHVQTAPHLQPDGSLIRIREAGRLHVKTFSETATKITGNVCLRLNVAEVERALDALQRKSIVWGYRVRVTIVNKLQPNDA